MWKQLSWSKYSTVIISFTCVYYLIIAVIFYRKVLRAVFSHNNNSVTDNKKITPDPEVQETQVPEQ